MKEKVTTAIILRVVDHGESDKIITFFSPELGKVTGIAKGAKRSRKRFMNKLEECTLLNLRYQQPINGQLLFLKQADLGNGFLNLRHDYRRYLAAALLIELIYRHTAEADQDAPLFLLLCWGLTSLNQGYHSCLVVLLFYLRLLAKIGYQPALEGCGTCHRPIHTQRTYTPDPSQGLLHCDHCQTPSTAQQPGPIPPLSAGVVQFLRHGLRFELSKLTRLRLAPQIAQSTLMTLHQFGHQMTQQEIRSWPIFNRSLALS